MTALHGGGPTMLVPQNIFPFSVAVAFVILKSMCPWEEKHHKNEYEVEDQGELN